MPSFVLPIFPRYGFDQSVTTPVLLGVLVSWFFTETFGWVFAGLVVPGYLASVFLLDAPGGDIDVLEAVITYGVARLIGEHLSRTGLTTRFFGRERFFLVVLVSVLVRLAVEAWILPRFVSGVWAYSVGLVVVPLAANACWKTGLWRGVVQNGVPTLIVYLVLRYVLTPYTNLSLAGFELATQNVAASFLGSPKAYILLITGALCAAAANVRYGWDFNGILVPALLGLALFKPIQFAATFAETVVLYFTVVALVRITPLRRANIEGPRRTVLFFTVDYGLRFIFAGLLGSHVPGEDIVSYTGFGYLVPTLMAVKISQKGSVPLIVLPTLSVSMVGFAAATLIGYAATLFDATREPEAPEFVRVLPPPPRDPAAAALWASGLASDGGSGSDFGLAFELSKPWDMFRAASDGDFEPARRAGFAADRLDGGVVFLRERFESLGTKRGLPTYLYHPAAPHSDPVVVLVADPRRDAACVVAAGRMVAAGAVDVAVIAGVAHPSDPWLETSAHAVARLLAEGGGLLVTLTQTPSHEDAPRAAVPEIAARADAMLPHLRASLGVDGAPGRFMTSAVVEDRELHVTLDGIGWAHAVAPKAEHVPLDGATAIAIALDRVRASTVHVDLEHLVALRRLLLEPLLAPDDSSDTAAARALAPFAAATLGYTLTAPTPGPNGHEVVALLPRERGLPIALVTRTSGVKDRLVEAPLAARRGVRDLAIRLAVALDSEAIVFGESWSGGMRMGAAREAQAAATDRATPEIFYVREDGSDTSPRRVELSAWMDDGRASAIGLTAVAALGLAASRTDLDAPLREVATRTLLRTSPLVSIAAGPDVERFISLESARRAAQHFSYAELSVMDATLADAARAVDRGLLSKASVSADFAEVSRRAASEESVVAEHQLAHLLETGARATLVRTADGTFLVGAARTPAGRELVSVSVDPASNWTEEHRSWAECIAAPVRHGVCVERAP